jgi:hypothetical protein
MRIQSFELDTEFSEGEPERAVVSGKLSPIQSPMTSADVKFKTASASFRQDIKGSWTFQSAIRMSASKLNQKCRNLILDLERRSIIKCHLGQCGRILRLGINDE